MRKAGATQMRNTLTPVPTGMELVIIVIMTIKEMITPVLCSCSPHHTGNPFRSHTLYSCYNLPHRIHSCNGSSHRTTTTLAPNSTTPHTSGSDPRRTPSSCVSPLPKLSLSLLGILGLHLRRLKVRIIVDFVPFGPARTKFFSSKS